MILRGLGLAVNLLAIGNDSRIHVAGVGPLLEPQDEAEAYHCIL